MLMSMEDCLGKNLTVLSPSPIIMLLLPWRRLTEAECQCEYEGSWGWLCAAADFVLFLCRNSRENALCCACLFSWSLVWWRISVRPYVNNTTEHTSKLKKTLIKMEWIKIGKFENSCPCLIITLSLYKKHNPPAVLFKELFVKHGKCSSTWVRNFLKCWSGPTFSAFSPQMGVQWACSCSGLPQ